MAKVLYDWQLKDAKWLAAKNRLLASDCGLGKTLIAIEAAKMVAQGPILVIAPRLSKEWWEETICEQQGGYVGVAGQAGRGIPWDRVSQWGSRKPLVWVIIHPEGLRIAYKQMLIVPWDTIIVDEAHRFKNRKAKQTQALWRLESKRKMLLTATPYGKSPADLWALLHYMYPKSYTSYWRFFERYVDSKTIPGRSFKIIKGGKNLDLLAREIAPFYRKRRKKDVLNLPPITYTDMPVSLRGKQEKLYIRLVKEAYAELVGKEVILQNGLVKTLRLQQCALDPSLLAEGVPKTVLGEVPAKVEWLEEWLEDHPNEPVIITSRFRTFVERWLIQLAPKSTIVGGMKTNAVQEALAEFNRTGRLVGTLDAIKESLNLQRASTMIVMDGTWSSVAEYQLSQRIHRISQTRPCHVIHLVAKLEHHRKWTVDKLIRRSVERKFDEAEMMDEFIRELEEQWKGSILRP